MRRQTNDDPRPAVRQALPTDADVVQAISASAYVPAYLPVIGAVPKPASEDYRQRIDRGEVWFLESPDGPCAVLVIEKRPDHLPIYSVAVDPRYQGRGLAGELLNFAGERALDAGFRSIRLYTNRRMARNLALYRRCGFSETGTRPHPSRPGEFLVDMEKPLAPHAAPSSAATAPR